MLKTIAFHVSRLKDLVNNKLQEAKTEEEKAEIVKRYDDLWDKIRYRKYSMPITLHLDGDRIAAKSDDLVVGYIDETTPLDEFYRELRSCYVKDLRPASILEELPSLISPRSPAKTRNQDTGEWEPVPYAVLGDNPGVSFEELKALLAKQPIEGEVFWVHNLVKLYVVVDM